MNTTQAISTSIKESLTTTLSELLTSTITSTATDPPAEDLPDIDLGGDEHTRTKYYNILLWLPFAFIPLSIILFRLVKYTYRFIKAKRAGQHANSLGLDPLMELSLTLTNNHDKLRQIKRIRKEQELIQKWKESAASRTTANDNAPHHNATDFLRLLRKRTQNAWAERLSPEAVRKLFGTTRFGRWWMIFQVFCTLVAIFNYIILTYSIHSMDRKFVKRLDVALAFVFALDYSISLYTAEDRLRFYFNFSSLVDLLSIIPTFVYFLVRDSGNYVWFLGLLRILRATRILRTYRLISFSQSEEKRELTILGLGFINFLFLSASVIHAFESLFDKRDPEGNLIREEPQLTNWHDSLYYIMVTFSTIGFGDLTPNTIPSRFIVMCLIVMVIIFVPIQTGKLSELYNSTNAYQRAKFISFATRAHVILSGQVSESSIIAFCREYFENDPLGHLVILAQDVPTLEVRRLLRHPYYRNRVHYLCGTPLSIEDLKRCSAKTATGIFLLSNGNDDEILMQSLSVRTAYPDIPIFAKLRDIKSLDMAKHCGIDRMVCADMIRSEYIARNCEVQGLLTILMNLVSTYQDVDVEEWKKEYHYGSLNHFLCFKVPAGFIGKQFEDVVLALYNSFGVTLFGVYNQQKFCCAPIGRIIKEDDVLVCMGTGGDDVVLRISIHFAGEEAKKEIEAVSPRVMNAKVMGDVNKRSCLALEITEDSPQEIQDTTDSPVVGVIENLETLTDHIIICGSITARALRNFVSTTRSISPMIPILCLVDDLPNVEGVWQDIMDYKNVHIMKGSPLKRTTIIRAGIEKCRRIVIFFTESDIKDAQSIFIVQLLKEDFPKVKFVVEMVNANNTRYFSMSDNTTDGRMERVLNDFSLSISDRLVVYKQIRGVEEGMTTKLRKLLLPKNGFRGLLSKEKDANEYKALENTPKEEPFTNAFLEKLETEAELNESGFTPFPQYHFDKHFAAGMVSTTAFMHHLLCQAYFRPYVISLMNVLAKELKLIGVPEEWNGKRYGYVYTALIQQGLVPFGLFRKGRTWLNTGEKMPYVYTNCKALDIVSSEDCLYVLEKSS